jgi:hemerythrin-like domain-containing protein
MIIIDQLKEEHRSILLMLEVLEAICKKFEEGKKVNTDDINGMIEFIKIYADKSHHLKEEDILFPAMEVAGIPNEGGPIGVMLSEHTAGREFVRGMCEATEDFISGNLRASSNFISNARNYIQLLSAHIYKEDNILYPMAETRLSDEKQEELLKEFETVDTQKIGLEKQKELIAILNKLKDAYL